MCRRLMAHVPAGRDVVWITPRRPDGQRRRQPARGHSRGSPRTRRRANPRDLPRAVVGIVGTKKRRARESQPARSTASSRCIARHARATARRSRPASTHRRRRRRSDRRRVAFFRWFEQLSAAQQTEVASPLVDQTHRLRRPRPPPTAAVRSIHRRPSAAHRQSRDRAHRLVAGQVGRRRRRAGRQLPARPQSCKPSSNAPTPPRPRDPMSSIYLDEFQNFIAGVPGTIETALQQLRKYGCSDDRSRPRASPASPDRRATASPRTPEPRHCSDSGSMTPATSPPSSHHSLPSTSHASAPTSSRYVSHSPAPPAHPSRRTPCRPSPTIQPEPQQSAPAPPRATPGRSTRSTQNSRGPSNPPRPRPRSPGSDDEVDAHDRCRSPVAAPLRSHNPQPAADLHKHRSREPDFLLCKPLLQQVDHSLRAISRRSSISPDSGSWNAANCNSCSTPTRRSKSAPLRS